MKDLGDRMKEYEKAFNIKLPRRMPIILRIDGRAFHSVLRKAKKPFDIEVSQVMRTATQAVLDEVQGAVFAYTQSDEINILINNYQSLVSEPWFDNKIQKMCSIAASTASAEWHKQWGEGVFDCRAFVLPKEEVVNYFIWRQRDWMRNSIQMLTRSLYSQKEVHKKNKDEMKVMCLEKKHDWEKLPNCWKYGVSMLPSSKIETGLIFSENRNYIQKWVDYEKEEDYNG